MRDIAQNPARRTPPAAMPVRTLFTRGREERIRGSAAMPTNCRCAAVVKRNATILHQTREARFVLSPTRAMALPGRVATHAQVSKLDFEEGASPVTNEVRRA